MPDNKADALVTDKATALLAACRAMLRVTAHEAGCDGHGGCLTCRLAGAVKEFGAEAAMPADGVIAEAVKVMRRARLRAWVALDTTLYDDLTSTADRLAAMGRHCSGCVNHCDACKGDGCEKCGGLGCTGIWGQTP